MGWRRPAVTARRVSPRIWSRISPSLEAERAWPLLSPGAASPWDGGGMLDTCVACRFACLWMRVSVSMLALTVTTWGLVMPALSPLGETLAATGDRRRPLLADASPVAATGPSGTAGRSRRPLVVIANLAAPPTFPGLGPELARSLRGVLSESGVDARTATGDGSAGSRGDAEHTLTGRIEDLGSGRLRLSLSWRGHSVAAVGDVEHLDDMAYAACEQLRPRLALESAAPDSPPSSERPVEPVVGPKNTVVAVVSKDTKDSKDTKSAVPSPAPAAEARKRPAVRPASTVVTPASVAVVPAVATPSGKDKPKEPEAPARPVTPATPPPQTNPPLPASPSAPAPIEPAQPPPQPATLRPRIAVHLVGEPMTGLPPAFYGAGAIAQQTTMAYLQNRLRYPAVGSRLTGLVGGLDALSQSLRLGARYTLMARFDTLVDGFGSFGTRTVSGRLHIVLLLDGRPLLDRSLSIPPSAYYPTEPATQVIARIVTAALDAISGELAARLGTPMPPQ